MRPSSVLPPKSLTYNGDRSFRFKSRFWMLKGKRALFDRTKALAVDMETAAVARAANQSGLPFFAFRIICDPANVSVPEALFRCVDEKGKPRLPTFWADHSKAFFYIPSVAHEKKFRCGSRGRPVCGTVWRRCNSSCPLTTVPCLPFSCPVSALFAPTG
jgi:hypothetical protein